MKVLLLNHFQTGGLASNEKLADVAAAMCVGKYTEATNQLGCKNLLPAINSGHDSVLEHLPLTWVIEDVSRALTHQLVRHRIASYSQQSQRYAKVNTEEQWFIIPESVVSCSLNVISKYNSLMEDIARFYNEMCSKGIPNEDARMVLPNACFTTLIMSMNARSFIEQCKLRLCSRAQWEIRELYHLIHKKVSEVHPEIAALAVPPCVNGKCQEVKPCKTPYRC